MKKTLLFILAGVVAVIFSAPVSWAQENSKDEFTLQEITVTAEKREVVAQKLPSSVAVIQGDNIVQEGKITTSQILESIPNVTYREGSGTNPTGNITIRGIQRTQESGGTNSVLPATTATYTDGVYQGIGGNYDANRVEVLRGPQGTLYGRSATGGVISFYTNDPQLDKLGGNISAEYGTADLVNVQGALNVPVGSKVALRAAVHYFSRDGYFGNKDGGKTKTKEGRLKALFQPTDALKIVVSLSAQRTTSNGGGYSPTLDGPNDINYKGSSSDVMEGSPNKYRQAAVNLNYDFGESTLTYVGGYHDYDNTGMGAPAVGGDGYSWHADLTKWPTDYYHSEELRWASNNDKQLTWLVGANYFRHKYDTSLDSVQTDWNPADTELTSADYLAPIFGQKTNGTIDNYGLFTEETYKLNDDFRITAGFRYDKTKLVESMYWGLNTNLSAMMNSKNPATWNYPDPLVDHKNNWDNFTYKLRFEYNLTPDNMIYALTATGFMPGYTALSPDIAALFGTGTLQWNIIQFDQQKLTSYEIGTKNQFLNDTLRVNGSLFYYDYQGYPEAIPVAMNGPSPVFGMFAVPLDVYGIEVHAEYLITMNDRLSMDAGWLDAEISEYPTTEVEGTSYSSKQYMTLKKLPGNPDLTATLDYDHTFDLPNGSQLAPRVELRYLNGYYLVQMTQDEVDANLKPYNHQDAYVLANIGATWTSADRLWSVTGYVRNAFDKKYKTSVNLNVGGTQTVSVGDPRTLGIIVNFKY